MVEALAWTGGGLMVMALFLPIAVVVAAQGRGLADLELIGRLNFLFGLMSVACVRHAGQRPDLKLYALGRCFRTIHLPKGKPAKDSSKSEPQTASKPKRSWQWLWTERQRLWRWSQWVFRAFHQKRLESEMAFGFSDPAMTGEVFGWTCALCVALPRWLVVRVSPDFSDRQLWGRLAARFSVIPAFLVLSVGIFGIAFFRLHRQYHNL